MEENLPKNLDKNQKPHGKASLPSRVSGTTNYLHIRNMKLLFNDDISVNTKWLMIKSIPLDSGNFFDLDDVSSYIFNIIGGEVTIDLAVMENIFNKYVLKGASLKNFSFSTRPSGIDNRKFVIKGEIKLAAPLPFTITATMTLDKPNNLIVITTDNIKTMGIIPTDKFMGMVGLSLENLFKIPPGRGVVFQDNSLIINPLSLFPHPRFNGCLHTIKLEEKYIVISFKQLENVRIPPRPVPEAVNDLFLFGGDVKIGQSRYLDMYIQILDRDPKGAFEFHIKNYFKHVSSSIIGFPHVNTLTISTVSYSRL
jgi:hypothetical protein